MWFDIFPRLGMLLAHLKWQPNAFWALMGNSMVTRGYVARLGYATQERGFLQWIWRPEGGVVHRLAADAGASYVASLAAKGQDAILKKVAEEAAEVLLASKDGDKLHLIRETADLWFHCIVLLAWHGAQPADVLAELRRREEHTDAIRSWVVHIKVVTSASMA